MTAYGVMVDKGIGKLVHLRSKGNSFLTKKRDRGRSHLVCKSNTQMSAVI